jgi:UDP-2-acetamido-3-amino-2,3-dideoxy-glucuronate N-acetyltransferase
MIHPLATIGDDVKIGAGARVWQNASVIRGAVVGEGCSIAAGAIVDGSRLGDRCIVSHCAFIDPGMVIGDDVFIGPFVAMCNDAWPRVEKEGWFDLSELVSGEVVVTRIENGASIGAHVTILPGRVIGAGSMIAAAAVVDKDVPPNCIYKRDGSIEPIDTSRPIRRMRRAA